MCLSFREGFFHNVAMLEMSLSKNQMPSFKEFSEIDYVL